MIGCVIFVTTFSFLFSFGSCGDCFMLNIQKEGASSIANSVLQTNDGGIIIVGSGENSDGYDLSISKLSEIGEPSWSKSYGRTDEDAYVIGYSVQQVTDGGFVVAGSTKIKTTNITDLFIARFTITGDLDFHRVVSTTTNDIGYSLVITNTGNYVVAGVSSQDILLTKFYSNGSLAWYKTYGGSNNDAAKSIYETTDGSLILTGSSRSFGDGSYDLLLIKCTSEGEVLWIHSLNIGTSSNKSDQIGNSVQQTKEGGYIVVGSTSKASYNSALIVKFTSTGNITWGKSFRTEYGSIIANSVLQTNDGGYVITGSMIGSDRGVLLAKVSYQGQVIWSNRLGKNDAFGTSIKQMKDGGYIFTATTGRFGDVEIGQDPRNIYVAKLDQHGDACNNFFSLELENERLKDLGFSLNNSIILSKHISTSYVIESNVFSKTDLDFEFVDECSTYNCADDSFFITIGGNEEKSVTDGFFSGQTSIDGGYYVAGFTDIFSEGTGTDMILSKVSSKGDVLWIKTFGGGGYSEVLYSVQILESNDGLISTGYTREFPSGYTDIFLTKFTSDGEIIWNTVIDGDHNDYGRDVKQTNDGFIVSGSGLSFSSNPSGSTDIYLIKFNSFGHLSWFKSFGGNNSEIAGNVELTSDGGFILCGKTSSFGQEVGSHDIIIIKLTENGEIIWSKTIGGIGSDVGRWIKQTNDGGYILTGETESFGVKNMDVYIIKLDEFGDVMWAKTIGGIRHDFGTMIQVLKETENNNNEDDKGYIIGGYSQNSGSDDYFLAKFSETGSLVWSKSFGDSGSQILRSVRQTSDGGFIIIGRWDDMNSKSTKIGLIKVDKYGKGCNMNNIQTSNQCINDFRVRNWGVSSKNLVFNDDMHRNISPKNVFYSVVFEERNVDINISSTICNVYGDCLNSGNCKFNQIIYNGENDKKRKEYVCDCSNKWDGNTCEIPICYPRCINEGVCGSNHTCLCKKGYDGDYCQFTFCFGIESRSESVCSKKGKCEAGNCICNEGYKGSECQIDIRKQILIIVISIISSLSFLTLYICFYVFCILLVVFCLVCGCCIFLISGVCGINLLQKRFQILKYSKLNNFDLLYQEQLLEQDTSVAHIQINKNLFEIEYEDIHIEKMIGSGGSEAHVFKSRWKNMDVAFKCFKTKRICSSQESFDAFEKEVEVMINLNHHNIIRFFGASLKPPRVGIVMEYCSNGEILNIILSYREENDEEYPKKEKIRMCQDIICGMEYVHSKSIIHRDLKSDNVLVDDQETCKLMDFGLSRVVKEGDIMKTKRLGTSIYIAPEILSGNYDERVDVFSFAILCYCVFTEKVNPYDSMKEQMIEIRVANDPSFRPDISDLEKVLGEQLKWISDLVNRCWSHDANERYSFTDLWKIFEENNIQKIEQFHKIQKFFLFFFSFSLGGPVDLV